MSSDRSLVYYRTLAQMARSRNFKVPAAHSTLFNPSKISDQYYTDLYLQQIDKSVIGKAIKLRPGGFTCEKCEDFHLKKLKNINKNSDVFFGNILESIFQEFLQNQLVSNGFDIVIERADQENLHMPDFKLVRRKDREVLAYFEFKAIFRPFLKIRDKVSSDFECYSHSLTLDISNGKKLWEQRMLVEQLGDKSVSYVYWYDLPCIKGVFCMDSRRVYELMDNQESYNRKEVAGDFSEYGRKRGATKKIYIPLLETLDLDDLIINFSAMCM